MKPKKFSIFRRITILIFALITVLCVLFILITYLATTHFYQASTQLLNKDVAGHIAKFSSPFDKNGINKRKADSVFQNAMVLSPSAEVYFLDTSGNVIAFHAPKDSIRLWNLSLNNIKEYIQSAGKKYIKGPDPKDPDNPKIFSASEVNYNSHKLGYIYVILGSNEYRNVSQMLFSSHVSSLAIEAFCIIILISIIISFVYLNSIQRSFKRMVGVLKKFEEGDFKARFKIKEQHELAPVTQAFNKMADLLVYNVDRLTGLENTRKDFIAHISHDLRTPLSIARGYTETLLIKMQDGSLTSEELDSYIQMILNKIFNVEHLVTMLFELSKIESSDFKLKAEPFVLSEIVQETVNTFQLPAKEKSIDLKCTQCQYHVWINADVSMMERVIQNLMENAVKNTPVDGVIKVGLSVEDNSLAFHIENTGEPLSQELITWINSPTVDDERTTKPSRSGLGLVIVKKILYLHGSQLRVNVTDNATNIFSFSLPVVTPQTS
ncbi:MAG: HAMP domain-containing histidine kinase [Bacteroidota bacterium]|nr:HAMP domain-containing histidine kinase [Bacteroidota bacterium]